MNAMESSTSVSPSQRPTVFPIYVISNSASGVALAAIGRDDAILAVSAPGIAARIEKGDVVLRLEDAPGWALPRHSQRLAGHDRVVLVRPHVELLNLVPVLRLVQWTIQIAEPRGRVELEIFSLIDTPVAVFRPASDRIGARLPSCSSRSSRYEPSCPSGQDAAPNRGVGADLSTGTSGFANTPLGICPVTLIAARTLAGTGATTYTLPVSVTSVVRSRTTAPFRRSTILPA